MSGLASGIKDKKGGTLTLQAYGSHEAVSSVLDAQGQKGYTAPKQ
jgi:hypothetical protein